MIPDEEVAAIKEAMEKAKKNPEGLAALEILFE